MDQLNNQTTPIIPNIPNGMSKVQFSWYDYALFIFMLLGSVFVGIYFGCFGNKQSTAAVYLMGDRKMKVVPVALSMAASIISGFMFLAVPVDIYLYGITYYLTCISLMLACIISYKIYLPVFYKLQLTSCYEYLEQRFNRSIKLVSLFLYILYVLLFLPIVMYVPALALAQATDINIHIASPIICGICIFYTTIGGLKAVVWTDAFQFGAMLAAMGAISYVGLINAGGFINVYNTAKAGNRLDIDTDINPLKRDTAWAVIIGMTFTWIGYIGVSQEHVQKFLSLPSMNDCKKATIIQVVGMLLAINFVTFIGLMMYTVYHDCDPISSKQVQRADQMTSYFVLRVAQDIPGLPGLFIAGIFSASLSSVSAFLNCISGIVYDFSLKPFLPKDISQKAICNVLKVIVLLAGILVTALVFVVESMGNLFPLGIKLMGLSQGPIIGLFTLGMMFPIANTKGAMVGVLTSLSCLLWMFIGAIHHQSTEILQNTLSIDGCTFPINTTIANATYTRRNDEKPFFLYKISHYYYAFIGAMIVIIVGLIASFVTNSKNNAKVNKDLIAPVMHFLIPQERKKLERKPYYSLDNALNVLRIETAEQD